MEEKQALVVGASGGVGRALAAELENRSYHVRRLSRQDDGLDITNEEDVCEKLGRLDTKFDLVIVATGILSRSSGPEKSIKALSADEMAMLFAVNAIGPALVLKHAKQLFRRDKRVVFAALSARVGSIGDNALGGWYSYRASKAALNQLLRTASIELKRTHKQLICTALHPGTVATEFTRNYPNHDAVPPAQAAYNLIDVIEQLSPEDSGHFFDWAGKEVPW
ncbi:SDR family NAD(P)-dependent oxidoreductase [Aliiroseovarius sp. S1339]|uniref:SDR family NAD(P)-dependent oxidoreductase n=1 Tax=Aliiroseovarius sp. S1339 TaxID=2936990 RepID=UPI0020C0E3ED|nr:SDR family NAD(P)-dependent oxidoreductase [Aliiroseovarius sp. S1339]MCK8464071.1 SDR family NAD(P)-dependent oxidoreductase [Aliiroseovarius sp. S1339]